MFAPDAITTTAYRAAVLALGFSQAHADLLLVERATRRIDRGNGLISPLFRITTGTDVMRGGRTMRRTLTLWYVSEQAELSDDLEDAETLADMMVATIPLLPLELRKTLLVVPPAIAARGEVVQIGLAAAHRGRRAG